MAASIDLLVLAQSCTADLLFATAYGNAREGALSQLLI